MKTFLLFCLLILTSCASIPDKNLSFIGAAHKNEQFILSDLNVLIKIDHQAKIFYKCEGVFPNSNVKSNIIFLLKNIKQNNIKYSSNDFIILNEDNRELLIYSLKNDLDLEHVSNSCSRMQEVFKSINYKIL